MKKHTGVFSVPACRLSTRALEDALRHLEDNFLRGPRGPAKAWATAHAVRLESELARRLAQR